MRFLLSLAYGDCLRILWICWIYGVSCAAIITKNAMMEEPYRLSHMTSHTATLRHLRCTMIGEVTREMWST